MPDYQYTLTKPPFLVSFAAEKIPDMDKPIDKQEIRKANRRKILLYGSGAAIVVFGFVWLIAGFAPSVDSRDITVSTAGHGPLEITVAASGRVVPAYEEIINSPVDTRLLQVFAQPGDTVKVGMPLLLLDLEQHQTALGKLRDERTIQEQTLRQLQLSNRTTLSDLEMQIKVNEMNVNRLRIDVDNERRLDSIGSGTGDRVRQAETAYAAGVLELEQLRTRLANEQLRTAAAERGQQLAVGSIDRDIALMDKTLHQGDIPAPLDGVLTFVVSDLGSRIGAGQKVAVVSDLSSFKILGEVSEGASSRVEVGAAVNVRINGAQLTGTVTNISPQAKQGVVSFTVSLDNPRESHLRSGGRAELYVSYGYKDNVLRVGNGSFYRGPGEYKVFVFDGDDRLERRKIKVGDCNREYVEILDGLHDGDRVVISDMENYKNDKVLKIKK